MDTNDSNGKLAALSAARVRLRVLRADGSLVRRDPLAKAAESPKSLRAAVTAKCWDCAGAGADGIAYTKETIRTCTVTCPLKPVRPYQRTKPWTGV